MKNLYFWGEISPWKTNLGIQLQQVEQLSMVKSILVKITLTSTDKPTALPL
jgi:hypothetical protein